MSMPMAAWALSCVALYLKMFAVAGVQAHHRLRRKVFTKPEDAARWGDGSVAERDLPEVERAQRTLNNDLENIPMFLLLGWAYAALGAWPTGALVYFPAFVVSRIVHTAAYLRPRQPLRNRAYVTGQLVCLLLSGHIVAAVVAST